MDKLLSIRSRSKSRERPEPKPEDITIDDDDMPLSNLPKPEGADNSPSDPSVWAALEEEYERRGKRN